MKNLTLYLLVFIVFVTIVGRNAQRQIDIIKYQGIATSEEAGPMLLQTDINLYAFMQERKFIDFSAEERKKFRHIYKFFEIQPYLLTQIYLPEKLHKYVFVLNHSIVLFLTYVVSILLFYSVYNKKKNIVIDIFISLIFILLVSYLFSTSDILHSERFTLIETLTISIALYSSIKQKIGLFVFSLLLGVSNRESAMALAVFYPLLNYHRISKKQIAALLSIAPIFFMMVNFDILSEITINLFIFHDIVEREPLTVVKYFVHSIKYVIFLLPLILLLYFLQKKDLLFKKISLLALIYIFIIIFGSYFGNVVLLFLFIPFYIVTMAKFILKIQSPVVRQGYM
jgi:hypothetical protein